MLGFPKYGSIENLYRNQGVLDYSVVVTEKLHGTNVRFMHSEKYGLVLGSRNNVIYKEGNVTHDGYNFTDFMLNHPAVKRLEEFLKWHNIVFYGEFHGSNIQKGVKYSDEKDLRIFDVKDCRDGKEEFLNWGDVETVCGALGLKTVPVLLEGMVTLDDLNQIVDGNSKTAIENGVDVENNIGEGLVIKPFKMRRDNRGNWVRAKYKSEKWAENAKAPKVRKPNPETAKIQAAAREFADMVVTPGRVATVVDHITRDGNANLGMSRTGDFLRAFIKDVMDEHKDFYKELEKSEINIYNKVVNGQAVPLWKDYLMG